MSVETAPMRIVINGEENLASVEPGSQFGAVLDEVRQWLMAHRVAILEIRLDGEPLSPGRQQELGPELADRFESLEIQAVEIGQLAREVLGSIEAHLPAISEHLVEITNLLQSGAHTEAFSRLDTVFEALGLVLTAVSNLRNLLGIGGLEANGAGEALLGREQRLAELLEEIKGAFRDQDLVTLGDCLEYELTEVLEDWKEVVAGLRIRLESSGGE